MADYLHSAELGVLENLPVASPCAGPKTADYWHLGTWGPVVTMVSATISSGIQAEGTDPFVCPGASSGLYVVGTPTQAGVFTFTIDTLMSDASHVFWTCEQTISVGSGTGEMLLLIDSSIADVQVQPFWSITESANNRNTFNFDLYSATGSYRPALDADVLFYDLAGLLIFGGNLTALSESSAGGYGHGVRPIYTRCSASDFSALTERVSVTTSIAAGTVKAALTALVASLSAYGVTLDAAQVNGASLAALSYTDKSLKDIFDDLAKLAGNWVWEISYTKKFLMFQPSATAAPVNVIDGNGVALGDIEVEPSRVNFANRVVVTFGANMSPTSAYGFLRCTTGNFANTETVTIGSRTYTFQTVLTNVAGNVLLGASASASLDNLRAAITLAAGSGTLYAAATTVHPDVTAVDGLTDGIATMRAQAIAPGAAGNAIAVSETSAQGVWFSEGLVTITTLVHGDDGATLSNRVQADDVASQDGGANLKIRTLARPDITSATVAQELADAELAASMASASKTVRYRTLSGGLHPGQTQTITVSWRNLTGTYLISEVVIRNTAANRVERFVTTSGGTVLPRLWRAVAQQMFSGVGGLAAVPAVGLPSTTLIGDVTGSGAGPVTATLSTVNGNVGSFGTATRAAVVTVDAKGRITAISDVAITTPGTGDVVGPSASVASEAVLFDGTTGKLVKRATGTGVVHRTSGVDSVSAVVLTSEVSGVLPIANIATGTPDGTKFVRDDGVLAVPSGGGGSSNLSAATVATAETQAASTAYGDLATSGPAVTLTLTGTVAIIWLSATTLRAGVGNSARISVDVSGASTVAAADVNAAVVSSYAASNNLNLSRVLVLTGLTPGSTTFTAKYSNDGGSTWTFSNRSLAVYAP